MQLSMPPQNPVLNEGIANFYDESSGLWESMWGEHMHHGYYEKGAVNVDNQAAQIDMVERTLTWAGVKGVDKVRAINQSLMKQGMYGSTKTSLEELSKKVCTES